MKKTFAILLLFFITLTANACSQTESIDNDTLIIGATPVPHSEILEFIRPLLSEQGYSLEIIEFTDYVLPNEALANEELDANFFQHSPYLESFNEANDTSLVAAFGVHFEPLGIYSSSHDDLTDIGMDASLALPNDASNLSRSLLLLQHEGLITLTSEDKTLYSLLDIVNNPYDLSFAEVEAASIPSRIDDVDYAIINGNYALNADILDLLIVSEDPDSDAAKTYGNIIAVKAGNENHPAIQTLKEILQSEDVRTFIEENYDVSVLPVF